MPTHQRERSSLSRSNPSPNNNNPREKRVVEVVEPQIIKTKSYKYANIMDVDQKRKQGNGGEDMSINFIKSRQRNPPDTSLAAISKPLAATSKVTTTRAVRESAPSPSPKLTPKNQVPTTKSRETDNNNKSPDRKSAKKRRFKWMHSGKCESKVFQSINQSTNIHSFIHSFNHSFIQKATTTTRVKLLLRLPTLLMPHLPRIRLANRAV